MCFWWRAINGCVVVDVGFRNSEVESGMIRRGDVKGDQAIGENVGKA